MIIPENKIEILKNIKLIALDLDRTLLTSHGLAPNTKETLEEAISRGIQVVIATGRPLVALPKDIWTINGLRYAICSNGAQIVDLRDRSFLYSDYIDPEISRWLRDHLFDLGYPIEVFSEGGAYISQERYQYFIDKANTPEGSEYVLTTRKPVVDIWEFWEQHIDTIENINIIIKDPMVKQQVWEELERLQKRCTVTSSTSYNIEIGGSSTSKAMGLKILSDLTGVSLEETMSFGDSPNDCAMLEESGFGVAVDNALPIVKQSADFVTLSCDDEGVAYAIRNLLLKER